MNDRSGHKRRLLYGRRQGHKLRPRQRQLMRTLLPRLALLPDDPALEQTLDIEHLFAHQPQEIRLEIGFGGGEHLLRQAGAHKNIGFLGCEPYLNGMARALSHIEEQGLDNVRLHLGDAREVIEALPAASIDRVYILYPDPWPKRRHNKRRFICDENITALARVMKQDAKLAFASDIGDYVRWTLLHMARSQDFCWLAAHPADWRAPPSGWQPTRYEAKALRQGRTPCYLTFRRV